MTLPYVWDVLLVLAVLGVPWSVLMLAAQAMQYALEAVLVKQALILQSGAGMWCRSSVGRSASALARLSFCSSWLRSASAGLAIGR